MSKRKKSSKKSSNILSYIAWGMAFVAAILVALISGYFIGYDTAKNDIAKKERKKEQRRLSSVQKSEHITKTTVNDRLKEVLKKEPKLEAKKVLHEIDATHEYDMSTLPEPPKRVEKIVSDKPKLAIIMDDVSVRSQVESIKSLSLPITMSFLPPSEGRPNSAKLAAKESFYMVHLPMEAKNFTKEEPFTLRVADSQKKIQERVEKIKQLFPNVKYINNHTGSKFTSNELAVNKLIYVLKKEGIDFIDSRTIATSKVPNVMKNYGKKYIARDVFLDHESDTNYIKGQIKEAVKIAKLHGTAIAIGHPHANTILAIDESRDLFKDIELVMVDRLY